MGRNKGTLSLSANIEAQTAAPLDARFTVSNFADLTNQEVWLANDGSDYTYVGMLTVVSEDVDETLRGVYRLNAQPVTDVANWKKVEGSGGTGDYNDLTNLPTINGVTISGDKTGTDYDLISPEEVYSPNVFNDGAIEINKSISNIDGATLNTNYGTLCTTEYTPMIRYDVISSTNFTTNSIIYYDKDKNFIGHQTPTTLYPNLSSANVGNTDETVLLPNKYTTDIAFARFNLKYSVQPLRPENIDTIMVIKNEEYPKVYVPYSTTPIYETLSWLTIKGSQILDRSISNDKLENPPIELFNNTSILVTGDGITKGESGVTTFSDYLKEWCGIQEVYNDGIPYTGIVASNGAGSPNIIDRCEDWETDYGQFDCIVINGNMEDGRLNGFLLGNFDDDPSLYMTSQYAALHTLIDKLITLYPYKKLVWVISTPRLNSYANTLYESTPYYNPELSTTFGWGITSWFEPYCAAIKEVCAHYGVPVLDLYHKSDTRPFNTSYKSVNYFNLDGTNLNSKGQEQIANKIKPFIEQNLGENY